MHSLVAWRGGLFLTEGKIGVQFKNVHIHAHIHKDECQVRLTGIEREYWMGTEIGRLGGYGFRGTVTASDGSNQKGGKMGAGYVNLRRQRKRQQRKVGRKEEGSSSNRPELAAFVLALCGTPVTKPMLYLCDNQALLKAKKMGR